MGIVPEALGDPGGFSRGGSLRSALRNAAVKV